MSHVEKRVAQGQKYGTVGTGRNCVAGMYTSVDKRRLVESRARGLGMTVSRYLNALVARDIGPGYEAS